MLLDYVIPSPLIKHDAASVRIGCPLEHGHGLMIVARAPDGRSGTVAAP